MPRIASADDLLKKKKAITRIVEIILDPDFADEWRTAETELEQAKVAYAARQADDTLSRLNEAEDALESLRPQYEECAVEMKVQGIGRKRYDALVAEHPPTKEQEKEARKGDLRAKLAFNFETFSRALFAESLVEPKLTEKQINDLFDSDAYNESELEALCAAAIEVNLSSKVINAKKG